MVKQIIKLKNTLHLGVVIQPMMLMIELMEHQNHQKEQTATITPLISMMKMLRKNGGDISSKIRIT